MEILTGIDHILRPLTNPVLTIGNFDGVHRGHQALFEKVKAWAGRIDGKSVVMTFDPHPLRVLFPGKGPALLTPHARKLDLIAACGIDVTIVIPFTMGFSRITARDFVQGLLVEKIGAKGIVVGYDYRFGHGREGNIESLARMGEHYGFQVDPVGPIRVEDSLVSSTAIRQLIKEGDMREAARLLGRAFEIGGEVQLGRQRGGRLMGFPTANVRITSQAPPKSGVYVVEANVHGKWYGGAANLGYNPTFGDTDLSLEVHIFDFDENIYGETISVRFIERLRSEKAFSGPQELSRQIEKDVETARRILDERRARCQAGISSSPTSC